MVKSEPRRAQIFKGEKLQFRLLLRPFSILRSLTSFIILTTLATLLVRLRSENFSIWMFRLHLGICPVNLNYSKLAYQVALIELSKPHSLNNRQKDALLVQYLTWAIYLLQLLLILSIALSWEDFLLALKVKCVQLGFLEYFHG